MPVTWTSCPFSVPVQSTGVFLAVALYTFVTFASNVYVQLTSSVNITPLLPDVHGTLKPYGYACSPVVRNSPGIRFAVVVGEQAYPTVAARARANVNEVIGQHEERSSVIG